jgi:ADP-L-glycero-D-manno-heptose 6-epimerase
MNRNILATGTEGFIGNNFLAQAEKQNFNIFRLDRESENWDAEKYLHKLEKIVKDRKFNSVVHLGAIASTNYINKKTLYGYNVEAVEIIANFCSKTATPLIFVSSAAIYGNEKGKLSAYAKTKLDGELILKNTPNLRYIALRLFNTYGFNEIKKDTMKSFISDSIISGLLRKTISIWTLNEMKLGAQSRDFIHVSDVNKIILKLIDKSQYSNETVDLGSGQSYKFIELANFIKSLEPEIKIEFRDPPAEYDRSFYQEYTCADISWLQSFEDGEILTKPFEVIPDMIRKYHRLLK